MKKSLLALPLLAILPLSAQSWEVGAFVGQQSLKSVSGAPNGHSVSVDPDTKTVFGLRVARSLVDLGPVLLQATAGYQPSATHTVTATTGKVTAPTDSQTFKAVVPGAAMLAAVALPATNVIKDDYKTSHFSVGAMATLRAFVSVGAGVEYRFEKLEMESVSTNYARPWGRVNAGISLPTPFLKPFFGIEAAVPLVSKSLESSSSNEDMLKAMAPKLQVGIYGGIRF